MNRQDIQILVADDHPGLVSNWAGLLERHGYAVRGAVGGEQAIALAKELCPQVVVMDVNMHDGTGMRAFHQIKQACPDSAMLFNTGPPQHQSQPASAAALLPKPFDIDRLLQSLDLLEAQ